MNYEYSLLRETQTFSWLCPLCMEKVKYGVLKNSLYHLIAKFG
jgi:hypothetical protein